MEVPLSEVRCTVVSLKAIEKRWSGKNIDHPTHLYNYSLDFVIHALNGHSYSPDVLNSPKQAISNHTMNQNTQCFPNHSQHLFTRHTSTMQKGKGYSKHLLNVFATRWSLRKYPEHQGVQMSGAYAVGMVAGGDDAKAAVINAQGIEVPALFLDSEMLIVWMLKSVDWLWMVVVCCTCGSLFLLCKTEPLRKRWLKMMCSQGPCGDT